MSHQTFKVCILIDDNVENFYIKHYVDEINPIFNRFKNQVFNRNPSINTTNLKIYWIDSEDDKILVSCEEDFRLYIEQGKGRKIYFCSNTNESQTQQNEEEPSIVVVPMESEDTEHRCDRRCRKGHKEEEKRRRSVKKLTDKLKKYEDCVRNEDERHSRKGEKREYKNAERLERAKRRVEQIKSIIGSIDPANLNSSFSNDNSASTSAPQAQEAASTSSTANQTTINPDMILSPETTRLLSNAIAGCLQPCTVINKVLNEVFALIPQVIPLPEEGQAATSTSTPVTPSSTPTTNTEQQTTEIPKQTTATNTSDANTPVPVRMANDEIEALFKEAAKELEKMNEIVKNSNKMETSTSTSSSMTGVTQIEKIYPNITDSCISDFFISENIEKEKEEEKSQHDVTDSAKIIADNEPTSKMGHSRESSIEVHDVGSIMSDDSRDWTMLSIDQEENTEASTSETPSRIVDPKTTGAIPKNKSVDSSSQVDLDEFSSSESKRDSIKSATAETQTQISIMSDMQQQQLQASVQKSIDIVKKSIQSIKKSADNFPQQDEDEANKFSIAQAAIPAATTTTPSYGFNENIYPNLQAQRTVQVENAPSISVVTNAASAPVIQAPPELTQANIKATEPSRPKFAPAVIVYDPNPKINAAVHTMMQMGFSNEDNWLTQLLINVDGDIPKALNFLTPQPKNKKE